MTDLPQYVWAVPLFAAVCSSVVLTVLLRHPGILVDMPNERSLHERPVPRTGGIAIVVGALSASALLVPGGRTLIALALLVSLVSLLDDWRGLAPLPRFGAQIVVAALFVRYGLRGASLAESIFVVLTIVWVANLFNFMDGSDGLAGGMALIGFSFYGLAGWIGGHPVISAISFSIAGAAAPFLLFNFHPARIFMGDVGSVTLGFLAASLGILGWLEGTWSPFLPIFVFSPFIADASLTLLRRVLARERFWQPHREHYYQKLVRMGWGHRNTALMEYSVMLIAGAAGIASASLNGIAQLAGVIAWGSILLLIAYLVDRRWARYSRASR
jgi:UDP-N-acetylmuramyl pentapeptide phosphotransferase/UDP-N-acetylglucosamine-1-phosphate transferase